MSYSPTENKIYYISCKLFGLLKAKKQTLVSRGSNDWNNILKVIKNHEIHQEHLESEINRNSFPKILKLDLRSKITHSANRDITEIREIVKSIIDAPICIGRQNIALRGYNEKYISLNKGNF